NGRWAVFTDPWTMFSGIRARQEKPDRSFNLYVYDLTAKKKAKHLRGQLEEWEGRDSYACVSADGKWLASYGGKVRLWGGTAGKQVWASKEAAQSFAVLGFTSGNKHLILRGTTDSAIAVVDPARAEVVRTIATGLFDRHRGTLLSPDGATVLMGLV